jgi:hypothetical protein
MLSVRDWAGQSNNARTGRPGCLGEELGHALRSRSLVRILFLSYETSLCSATVLSKI